VFRQIRMNRWRAEATPQQIEAAIAALGELPAKVAELRGLVRARDLGLEDDTFDFVLITDFDDRAAYERYMSHPAHREIVQGLILPILESTSRVHYEWEPD
jgi:hypothetical protein